MKLSDLEMLKALSLNNEKPKRVTRSYRKGRRVRVQQIYDRHGFVVKQIIHVID